MIAEQVNVVADGDGLPVLAVEVGGDAGEEEEGVVADEDEAALRPQQASDLVVRRTWQAGDWLAGEGLAGLTLPAASAL